MSENTNTNLKAIVRKFVTAHNATSKASVTAAQHAVSYLTAGGSQGDLVTASGVDKSTVSRYVTLGKALALVPDAEQSFIKRLVDTVYGRSNGGDRKALVAAIKDESSAGVVAAVRADAAASKVVAESSASDESDKSDKGSNARKAITPDDMTTEALLDLIADLTEKVALREDMPGKNADRLVKMAKVMGTLAKSLALVPVA
jgi:hypothetical protein